MVPRKRKPAAPCSVDGCDRPSKARGWCNAHYLRWKRYGDLDYNARPSYGQGRRTTAQGYIEVWCPGHPCAMSHGYALEHRKMAYDAGMLTDLSMHVHHRNEDKTDNRLDNFEVKSSSSHAAEHTAERGYVVNQFGRWQTGPKAPCSSAGCEKPVHAKGVCGTHYAAQRRAR